MTTYILSSRLHLRSSCKHTCQLAACRHNMQHPDAQLMNCITGIICCSLDHTCSYAHEMLICVTRSLATWSHPCQKACCSPFLGISSERLHNLLRKPCQMGPRLCHARSGQIATSDTSLCLPFVPYGKCRLKACSKQAGLLYRPYTFFHSRTRECWTAQITLMSTDCCIAFAHFLRRMMTQCARRGVEMYTNAFGSEHNWFAQSDLPWCKNKFKGHSSNAEHAAHRALQHANMT